MHESGVFVFVAPCSLFSFVFAVLVFIVGCYVLYAYMHFFVVRLPRVSVPVEMQQYCCVMRLHAYFGSCVCVIRMFGYLPACCRFWFWKVKVCQYSGCVCNFYSGGFLRQLFVVIAIRLYFINCIICIFCSFFFPHLKRKYFQPFFNRSSYLVICWLCFFMLQKLNHLKQVFLGTISLSQHWSFSCNPQSQHLIQPQISANKQYRQIAHFLLFFSLSFFSKPTGISLGLLCFTLWNKLCTHSNVQFSK